MREKKKEKKNPAEIFNAEYLMVNMVGDYTTIQQKMILKLRKGLISKEQFLQDARQYLEKEYHTTTEVADETMHYFEQYVFSYWRLTPLIEDPEISDIRCIAFDDIRVKKRGIRMDSGIQFRSGKEYKNFIDFVATRNQVNVSNLNAIQRFTDNKSSADFILRFTVTMPLVNTPDQPYLTIRKVPRNFPEIQDLVAEGMLSQELADMIVERFRTGSTLICGGNSSGKTTLLNALKEKIDSDKAVLIVQQADELTTKKHPDMMFLHSLPNSGESQISYDLKDISIAGLTMDVDYFIVGEIKGEEALYMLNAAYTGQICAGTIHAPDARRGINKVADYAMYGSRYSRDELLQMLDCFKTVIFMKDYKVDQVYEVSGWNPESKEIEYKQIFER